MLKSLIHKILCSIGLHSFVIKSFSHVEYECKHCPKLKLSYRLFSFAQAINQKNLFFNKFCLTRNVLTEKSVKTKRKNAPMVCPITGQINLEYNPEIMTQDYFIPLRG